ncbi:hypothetical protein CFC21_087093 [Triticum aestivum]|uniref:RING-type E3 ubiquitin transferase n=3 Tax=Triticum TaxID=4564 RepID=A0A9R1B7W8_TRITD|nr:hypothetical protein CFC21_087093 [Triticum aestivum]VAI54725.1 unnamed protein product [Triticum turgidum subsp. durum]
MPNLLARLGNGGRGACYGVVASLALALVFCVLVATVSVWKAFLFAGMALTAFGIGECLAPNSWRVGAAAEREITAGVPLAACRFGLGKATIDSLPTFAYASCGADADADLECGSAQLCSVCLEDLEDGEMVRELPSCKHIFHVECIDMWLHSHTTCPICRCDLSPQRTCTSKVAAVETEPPAVRPPV